MKANNTILISGASGNLGQMISKKLIEIAPADTQIVLASRNTEKLGQFRGKNIEVREIDFNDPEKTKKALIGVNQFLIISTDAIGSRFDQHKVAIDAAKSNNVDRVIYTSWPEPKSSVAMVAPEHKDTENYLEKSGLKYTILRNSLYSENLLGSVKNALETGKIYGSADQGSHTFVSRSDCANAAAYALLKEEKGNKIYNITGDQNYSYYDLAQILTDLSSKKVEYINLSDDEFKSALTSSGLPEIWADVFVSFDKAHRLGEAQIASRDVQELTGKSPETLKEFLKRNIL